MPLVSPLAFALGEVPGGLSSEQALDLLVQLLPDGFARWTGILNRRGDVYNFFAAIADSFKVFVYDGIAQLRLENNPATAGWRLQDYEAALGLSTTPTALAGIPQKRRLQIISKLREQGAATLANVRSIVGPLLGYADPTQLQVFECSRAALTAAHTYTNGSNAIFSAGSPVSQTVYVADDGSVSDAGVQLFVTVTATNAADLQLTLTGPSGGVGSGVATKSWPAGTLPAANVSAQQFRFTFPEAAGKKLLGDWTLTMSSALSAIQVITWSVFAEGGGMRDLNGGSGLGEEMHEWGVFVDPALVSSPDIPASRAALDRIKPADSIADLLYSVVGAFPDVAAGANAAIPDGCLPVAVDPPSPLVAWRSSTPVPMTSGGPGAGNRVYHVPLPIPSDVSAIALRGGNRTYAAGVGSNATIDAAAYASDGSGAATGLATGVLSGVTLLGNGAFSALGALPVVAGADKKVVLVHSFPDPVYANSIGGDNGSYSNATLTVSPLPGVTGPNPSPVFWFNYGYSTARRRVAVIADSIGGGYSPDSSVGFQNSAWNKLMQSQDWAVNVQSVVQYGSLQAYANFGGLPYLWDQLDDILPNAYALVAQLGTNDLAYLDLGIMQTSLQSIIAHAQALGVPRILAWTIPPQTGYADPSNIRGQFNTWLRANWVSLGLFAIYDAAAAQSVGGIADNTTQTSIFAGYATVDNTHPSIAGQNQIAAGWLAKLP